MNKELIEKGVRILVRWRMEKKYREAFGAIGFFAQLLGGNTQKNRDFIMALVRNMEQSMN